MFPVLENCRICGKAFSYTKGPKVCEACREELERIFFKARNVLLNSPESEQLDVVSLAEKLGVEPIYVYILAEEGLLEREAQWPRKGGEERERLLREFNEEIKKLKENPSKDLGGGGMFIIDRKERKEGK